MTLAIPTASSIKMRFTEFADVSDPQVEFAIEEARVEFGSGANWTAGADIGLAYLVAHFLSCSIANAASGGTGGETIASESIGRLSISYAQKASDPKTSQDDYSSTSYGLRYLSLVQKNFSGAQII